MNNNNTASFSDISDILAFLLGSHALALIYLEKFVAGAFLLIVSLLIFFPRLLARYTLLRLKSNTYENWTLRTIVVFQRLAESDNNLKFHHLSDIEDSLPGTLQISNLSFLELTAIDLISTRAAIPLRDLLRITCDDQENCEFQFRQNILSPKRPLARALYEMLSHDSQAPLAINDLISDGIGFAFDAKPRETSNDQHEVVEKDE